MPLHKVRGEASKEHSKCPSSRPCRTSKHPTYAHCPIQTAHMLGASSASAGDEQSLEAFASFNILSTLENTRDFICHMLMTGSNLRATQGCVQMVDREDPPGHSVHHAWLVDDKSQAFALSPQQCASATHIDGLTYASCCFTRLSATAVSLRYR